MQVTERFNLFGDFPSALYDLLAEAVEATPESVFFDASGDPLKRQVTGLDRSVSRWLREQGHQVETDHEPIDGGQFTTDIFLPSARVLIEIEKGNLPRISFDILKMVSGCAERPEECDYGAFIVPSSYIRPTVAGRQTTTQYLKRLARLVAPLASHLPCKGIGVIAYRDPRGA
jgi:hypothetical protein